jgi:phosphopentomutase
LRRVILIVLDGCGAGAAPDHALFGDGPDVATVRNVWNKVGGFHAPNLAAVGFLRACGIEGDGPSHGSWGRLRELSMGKDSVTGHWEMMGYVTKEAFPTYPEGFPAELVAQFESAIGRKVIGNRAASGTEIIATLGDEMVKTCKPILYTSADSVFQLAAHEDVVPLQELYRWCEVARKILVAPDNVQRLIARPFSGPSGAYVRTTHRRDFPLPAPANLVDRIGDVFGIGVVPELFDHRGFRPGTRTQNNSEHGARLFEALHSDARFIFANFEDFDMLYGHRNDPIGFARCLEAFDNFLGDLLGRLGPDDLLLLTADHGNDPTSPSTDHSREYVPFCQIPGSGPLGDQDGMFHVGQAVAAHLNLSE